MSPRPSRTRSLLVALAMGVAGCSSGPNVNNSVPGSASGSGVSDPYLGSDASDTGTPDTSTQNEVPEAASGHTSMPALFSAGSPLCSAAPSPSDCQPDDPTGTQACQHAPDAGIDPNAAAGSDAATLACHVAALGDAAGQPTCLPAGTGTVGQKCYWPLDCAPGLECVGTGTCQPYCCGGNSKCGQDAFCDIQPVTAFTWTKVPVCMPLRACTLFQYSCDLGETCAVVKADGTTSCVAAGTAQAGDSCDTSHCGLGLACLGASGARRCYKLCHTAPMPPACPLAQTCKGGLPLFPDPDFGICQ
jgi:hypothetical protein